MHRQGIRIDFEDMDTDMWKYIFKDIDTNDLLELHEKNKKSNH